MLVAGIFTVGSIVLIALVAYGNAQVNREIETGGDRSLRLVACVWALYGLHAALVVLASCQGTWTIGLPSWSSGPFGWVLLGAGSALCTAGAVEFRSLKRMNGRRNDELITSGVYRYTRNPQNVGLGLAYVGIALVGSSGLALLLAVLFWAGLLSYLPREEQLLSRLYGDDYHEYQLQTARIWSWPRQK